MKAGSHCLLPDFPWTHVAVFFFYNLSFPTLWACFHSSNSTSTSFHILGFGPISFSHVTPFSVPHNGALQPTLALGPHPQVKRLRPLHTRPRPPVGLRPTPPLPRGPSPCTAPGAGRSGRFPGCCLAQRAQPHARPIRARGLRAPRPPRLGLRTWAGPARAPQRPAPAPRSHPPRPAALWVGGSGSGSGGRTRELAAAAEQGCARRRWLRSRSTTGE